MLDKKIIEEITDELVILSLTKDLRIYGDEDRLVVYLNGRHFFSVSAKMKRKKIIYRTMYKSDVGTGAPTLETYTPKYVLDQVKGWIEEETIKGKMG